MSKSVTFSSPGATFARNVDWNLFKVFYEIGQRGGIGAASRSLNKQQPSVSAALQRLESHLGTHLCTRTSRGIELTVQGHQVLEACQAMYQTVQKSAEASDLALLTGSLSLKVISNLYLVPQLTAILQEFHERYPRIEVRLDVAPWRDILRALSKSEVELGIGFKDAHDDKTIYIPIIEQQQQIYCGPSHPLFGKPPVSPSALESDAFVVTHDEPTAYVRYKQGHGLGKQIGGIADNLQERMWLIKLGMGIGMLPKPVVDASNLSQELWPLLHDHESPRCTIYIMTSDESVHSAPAQLFLETATNRLAATA
ncbi:MAG: LysR family transcriptional regulator [Pantoea sp.]|uniref:LysR family transcriptional regulator n=1 Tax=Pantoea sp. TaxID=69393 RepID=UPI002396CBE5|nr:LysR family transcriptional regulator [Pantoea sp.]MDE1186858.1 LysR family transcriptional regulator [Pantoea sp.]